MNPKRLAVSLGALGIFAGQSVAAEATSLGKAPGDGWTIEIFGLLAILCGAAIVLLRLKTGGFAMKRKFGDRLLAIEETLSIGPRRHLLVVRVGGRFRLIGATDHEISDLGEIPSPNAVPKDPASALTSVTESADVQ